MRTYGLPDIALKHDWYCFFVEGAGWIPVGSDLSHLEGMRLDLNTASVHAKKNENEDYYCDCEEE